MARLKLNPDPTFLAKVEVPVPGGTAEVACTFKYRDRKEAAAWHEERKDAYDVDVLLDVLVAWDLDDELNRENVERLCNAYPGAAGAILLRYARELSGIRQGN